jgi:tetratricopeptide (TPR) repeat protein
MSIDFTRVYQELIQPALEQAGVEPFRPDQEQHAGDICPDNFQELLLADLVLADLTIDNPAVWYALGVRHALRARGVVLISAGQACNAFDRFTGSRFGYGLSGAGPDPARLATDREALAGVVTSTLAGGAGPRTSPVFALLPQLREPPRDNLWVRGRGIFGLAYEAWEQGFERASRTGRIADALVLADEAPEAALRARAWIEAGMALAAREEDRFAIEQLDRGLSIEPDNLTALRQKGRCLRRLALAQQQGYSRERAMAHVAQLLETHPRDAEAWDLAGRVVQDDWLASWRRPDLGATRQQQLAFDGLATLHQAQILYLNGFRADPSHVEAGLQALTLMHLAHHLGDAAGDAEQLRTLSGAVRFAARSAAMGGQGSPSFKTLASLGELAVLEGSSAEASAAYGMAVSQGQPDHAAVDACRSQLLLLRQLGFRPEVVQAALAGLDRAFTQAAPPQAAWRPRQVILFSGHMIDRPQRPKPRFPPSLEAAASQRIEAALAELDAGAEDLAISQAASGGDLLFLEACQRRGVRRQVLLPFEEAEFLAHSILPSLQGDLWRQRFDAMRERLDPSLPLRIMPEALGPAPKGRNPYERCNDWLLYSGLCHGLEKLCFLCLWDGEGGDGRGGTAHMVRDVEAHTGRVIRIDTHSLASV